MSRINSTYKGFNAIREALLTLDSKSSAVLYVLSSSRGKAKDVEELIRARRLDSIIIKYVDRKTLDKIEEDNKGCILVCSGPTSANKNKSLAEKKEDRKGKARRFYQAGEFLDCLEEDEKNILCLALDGVQDVGNLAAIIRSADCFSLDLLILPKAKSASITDKVFSLSQGALAWVSTLESSNLVRDLEELKKANFWLYGLDAKGEDIYQKDIDSRCIFVSGGEGFGLSRLVREKCDFISSIPMKGHIDSLNVSVASALAMAEYRRRKGF